MALLPQVGGILLMVAAFRRGPDRDGELRVAGRWCVMIVALPVIMIGIAATPLSPSMRHVQLTRRRDFEAHQETWRVFYGDVRVGTIARSVGNPNAAPMAMALRLLSGSRPGECKAGVAPTFDQARADFEAAWRVFRQRALSRL